MILRFYKLDKSFAFEKDVEDAKIVSEVESGDSTLSFDINESRCDILPEWYVETKTQWYVIKEKNSNGSKIEYVCNLNLEDLEAKEQPSSLVFTDVTINSAAGTLLNGTGWAVGECDVAKVRNVSIMGSQNSLNAIKKLCTAFICEPVFDTKNKTVSFYDCVGEDRGVYFMRDLNLKSLSIKQDSYDYYTVIIPIGKDDLTIENVNNGVGYLENYQYSNKRKVLIWNDTDYTDAQALKDDAELKLDYVSKPVVAYSGSIIDLASVSDDYSILDYSIGDYIWLVDEATGTRERQRILKLTEYPDNPNKNEAEFCNLSLSFDDMQSKYKAAADLVTATISSDGKISLSDILHIKDTPIDSDGNTIGGILRIASEAGTTADGKNKVYYSDTKPDVTGAKAGDTWFDTAHGNKVYGWNGTKWDDKQFGGDAIQDLAITNAKISNLDGARITADKINANDLHVKAANIDGTLTASQIDATNLKVAAANVTGKLTASQIDATNLKVAAANVTGTLTASQINATNLKVAAANVTGTLTASQIDATNLKVAAANVTGTIKATDIDATTGKIANFTIATTGLTSVSDTTKGRLAMVHGSGYDARFEVDYTYDGVRYLSKLIPQGILASRGGVAVSLSKNPNGTSWYTPDGFAIGSMLTWDGAGYGVHIQNDGQLGIRRDSGGTIRLWHGTCAKYVNLKCQDSDPSANYTVRLPNSSGTVALTSSDIRIKENFKDTEVDDALSVIDMIKMRSYDWTDQSRADPHQKIGFIADELEEIDPKFVLEGTGGYDSDGEMNIKGVDSFYLQGYEIKAIQELHKKIIELENEIRELKGETVS